MTGFSSPERAPAAGARPFGTTASPRPTTLSGRAARRLAQGPLDAVTLMREVCQVERLQADAAERMAQALLGSHPEFIRLPSGHWALASASAPDVRGPSGIMVAGAPATGAFAAPESAPDDPGPSLRDITFSVVDVETTGTRAAGDDRITEIAIATVRGGAVIDVYSQLVNPERPIPPYITALTQISWEMVRDQPRFRHVADQVLARLAGSVFVAHNASFDWRFVSEEIRRGVGHELSGPRLCTVRLARVLLPELSRRSLDHLTHHFGIAIEARHRAAGDAVATAQALCRMLIIAERDGVRTWAELDALVNSPASRRRRTASDRRRRAFPLPVQEDSSA
ncbi:PolC-type DNA polymerase III [Gemmatimonas sp.]|uniref:PolC-type DNA polymerase III n=1 Tax=Gemmatimonas sp. TaxID=1962908 RepID=UPI0037BE5CD7